MIFFIESVPLEDKLVAKQYQKIQRKKEYIFSIKKLKRQIRNKLKK